MIMRRILFYQIVLVLLGILVGGCSEKKTEAVSTEKQEKEYPSQEMWNSELYLSKEGRNQAVVRFGHMIKYDSKDVFYFDEGVQVDFFDKEGNHTSHLTSDRGEYFEKTEDVRGLGNVVVVSDSGVTLHTAALRWDNRRGKIISDTLVRVTTQENDTLYGIGFESNADLSRRVIRKPWGVSTKKIDFDKLEMELSKPAAADSLAPPDSAGKVRK